MNNYFHVKFHGGPCAGQIRAYPGDMGDRISLPTSNGSEVVYERFSLSCPDLAKEQFEKTGAHIYTCIFNGLARPDVAEILKVAREVQEDQPMTDAEAAAIQRAMERPPVKTQAYPLPPLNRRQLSN